MYLVGDNIFSFSMACQYIYVVGPVPCYLADVHMVQHVVLDVGIFSTNISCMHF